MKQEKALSFLKAGKNVFLTGSAGTGKTYVLNQYIQYLKARKISSGVTASTGIAATHINGLTIHGWSGMGVRDHIERRHLNLMASKKYIKDPLSKVKVLIIDEISMLHKKQLEIVNTILQYFKNSAKPFGGVQVVLCGDFFQLPPVGSDYEQARDKFCFMSPVWVEAGFHICYLTEQYRQKKTRLTEILNQIRNCTLNGESLELLKERNLTSQNDEITKLYTHNIDVDRINNQLLDSLSTPLKLFKAKTTGNPKLIEGMSKSVLAGKELKLKKGAKVMFIKNNYERGYVNGTLGTIMSFNDEGFPVVQTAEKKFIVAKTEDWEIRNDAGKKLAGFKQIPLQLAWAITVHKSQGMTLDEAEIDLSKTFENGQGYVALSRLKTLDTLYLKGFNEKALQTDPLAFKADQRFQELSKEIDIQNTQEELEALHAHFVEWSGGLTSPDAIKKEAKKVKEAKKPKVNTLEVTKQAIKRGIPVEKIASDRGVKVQTIYNHFKKIKAAEPHFDFSLYKPKEEILNKVMGTYHKLYPAGTPKEEIKLKPLHDAFNKEIPYELIHLSLLFL